jgi:hypothetical protein
LLDLWISTPWVIISGKHLVKLILGLKGDPVKGKYVSPSGGLLEESTWQTLELPSPVSTEKAWSLGIPNFSVPGT